MVFTSCSGDNFRSEFLAVLVIPILTAAITRILTNVLQVMPVLFAIHELEYNFSRQRQ
ncbi:hypothetical protein [Clostridium sp. ZBS15]|uniref:hypothetical protein n=1 Tax=Clostridium sp. ZBS15 TaxID=2949969 RepID=UPI0020798D88|nr:hypothetical protein [Clostridium sp. ZBS15]